jgi:hypothetical protein
VIAVYARRDEEEAFTIRETLRAERIPCALIGPEFGFADAAYRVPFVMFTKGARQIGASLARRLPPRRILVCPPDVPLSVLIRTELYRRYSLDMEHYVCGSVRFRGDDVLYRGYPLKLTPNEERIVRLLAVCGGRYFSGEEIAAFCLYGDEDAAAVHVCHLNRMSRDLCGADVIECRRYLGYRVRCVRR